MQMLRGNIIREGNSIDTTHFTAIYCMRMPGDTGCATNHQNFYETQLGRFIRNSFGVDTMLRKVQVLLTKTFEIYNEHYLS